MVKKKEEKSAFFVEVQQPVELKRNLLQVLKEIVETLQRFEEHKEIRKEKAARIGDLRKMLKNLNKDMATLKSTLPESKLRGLEQPKPKRKGKVVKATKVEKPVPIRKSAHVEQLESEIAAIEEKLKALE